MRGWWCSIIDQRWKAVPPPPERTPHKCADVTQNSWSFSGPPLGSQSEISFKKAFYRLSRSHRFNMESLSQFGLAVIKGQDGFVCCPAGVRRDVYPKVTTKKRNK